MRQKGVIHLVTIIIVAALTGIGYWGFKSGIVKISLPQKGDQSVPSLTPTPVLTISPTTSPSATPTVKPAVKKTPTPTVTSAPAATPWCNYADYDFNSPTGAVQFIFNPTKGGSFYWTLTAEIKARNGCKVLDGKTTDTIQVLMSSTSNNVSIPGIPPGTYEVRYSYHYVWSSSQTVSVISGQQTNATFTVDNSSDP